MKIYYSHHSQNQMEIRQILEEWVYLAILAPDLKIDHTFNSEVIYHFKKIIEANNKVLRVVVKKIGSCDEYLVITCYFDRKMRINL
jgi:hypothetical protein